MSVKILIQTTSALTIGLTGITVLIMWIVVVHDKGKEVNYRYECHGCNYIFHEALEEGTAYREVYAEGYTDYLELNEWSKKYNDPYPAFIGFGVTIGMLWITTSFVGYLVNTKYKAWAYFLLGATAYILFVIAFLVLYIRMEYAEGPCGELWNRICEKDNYWEYKHRSDSFDQFWGSAILGFVVGAYQLGAAIYLINQNEVFSASETPVTSQSKNQ
eukprot:TRINITY_DN147_c0_g1_i2.p2 TRINITY_DN147_c0_g1~~TRINITY_DN147_c0_g1_i2.p2  ORF type:complete len:216 (-),score=5.20 TRINITY_DN147_c0_g1_i2:288-935(-)